LPPPSPALTARRREAELEAQRAERAATEAAAAAAAAATVVADSENCTQPAYVTMSHGFCFNTGFCPDQLSERV
jgi:hypothetical protein